MRTFFLLVSVLATCERGSDAGQSKPRAMEPGVFLRKAVVEGLKEDGVDRAFVKECFAEKRNLFVLKCPNCEPVRTAVAEYAQAQPGEKPPAPAEGKGLPKDIVDDLRNPDRLTQLKAVERLVDRYVSRHYERLGMSAEERRTMQAALEERKKDGIKMMKEINPQKNFGDFCPSCNGATKAK